MLKHIPHTGGVMYSTGDVSNEAILISSAECEMCYAEYPESACGDN